MAMAAMQCELPLGRILSSSLSSVLLPQRRHWSKRSISTRPGFCCSSQSSVLELLDRRWMLADPAAQIHQISVLPCSTLERQGAAGALPAFSNEPRPSLGGGMQERRGCRPSFYIIRDDLLHPLVNGNKARKLDAVLPILQEHSVTDVVTCGGCQSAHAAAVAVSCAERGIRSHLLLRGEQPDIPTGYNLISVMYGNTSYIPRSLYAKREEMLSKHANLVAGGTGSVTRLDDMLTDRKSKEENVFDQNGCTSVLSQIEAEKTLRNVVIINEGAGDAGALLGAIRLVKYLSQTHLLGMEHPTKLVLDAGTGTTAIGLGLGAKCLGLPWKVVAVMLADITEGYKRQEKHLLSDFKKIHGMKYLEHALSQRDDDLVQWVERIHPRKFGKVLGGEIETCRQIAQQTGILVDPVYTLAAWEHATLLCQEEAEGNAQVVMLHTGGTLGMFGLAQRYKPYFHGA